MSNKLKKVFILSAGNGERLKPLSDSIPKTLLKIKGKEILIININNLKELSLREFFIVVNKKFFKKMNEFLRENEIEAKVVINDYPERENGYSLFLLKDYIEDSEKFIILMGDHLYERNFLLQAIKGNGLIVDELGKYINKVEATKVCYEERKIIDIGKNLKKFNAFDTGFIIADKEFIKFAIELEREKEKITITDIIKRANLEVSTVSGYFWMDIDTYEDFKKANVFLNN